MDLTYCKEIVWVGNIMTPLCSVPPGPRDVTSQLNDIPSWFELKSMSIFPFPNEHMFFQLMQLSLLGTRLSQLPVGYGSTIVSLIPQLKPRILYMIDSLVCKKKSQNENEKNGGVVLKHLGTKSI